MSFHAKWVEIVTEKYKIVVVIELQKKIKTMGGERGWERGYNGGGEREDYPSAGTIDSRY